MSEEEIVRECPACGFCTDWGESEIESVGAVPCENDACRVETFHGIVDHLRRAYVSASFEMVDSTEELTVPVSDPAVFEFDAELSEDEFEEIQNALHEDYLTTVRFAESREGSRGVGMWIATIREGSAMCEVKVKGDSMEVYPETEDFVPFDWFERLYDLVGEVVDSEVRPRTSAGDQDGGEE